MRTAALGYANSSHARQVDATTLAACLRSPEFEDCLGELGYLDRIAA